MTTSPCHIHLPITVIVSAGGWNMAKVLLVEDDEAQREFYETLLYYNGFDVITAEDGPSGVDCALREAPDAIILDIMLPGMSGLLVAQSLHTNPATSHIPIICTSAYDVTDDMIRPTGATDFLRKPVPGDVLVRTIRRHIGWNDAAPPPAASAE